MENNIHKQSIKAVASMSHMSYTSSYLENISVKTKSTFPT